MTTVVNIDMFQSNKNNLSCKLEIATVHQTGPQSQSPMTIIAVSGPKMSIQSNSMQVSVKQQLLVESSKC